MGFDHFTSIRRWYALHLILGVTFFISSLIINTVQFLFYATIRPLNRNLFRRINYYLMYSLMSQIMFLAEWWSGSEIKVYCTDDDFLKFGREPALVVMNHTCEVDWLMGWIVADRFKILGSAKVFVKNMIKYVPTIGWAWSTADVIFLKRSWKEDKNTFSRQIPALFDYPHPVWLLLFCEGTRFTAEKHAASMKFARENGIGELKHLLIPRTRGFVESVRVIRGNFKALYDVTISFNTKDGAPPTLRSMMRGQKVIGDMYIKRRSLDEIPSEEEKTVQYLHELYQEKDALLDNYHKTGSFWDHSSQDSIALRRLPRRYYSLLNVLCWAFIVSGLIALQYYSLLTTGSLVANTIAVSCIVLAYFGLYKMIGLTKISKASKYGDR